MKLELCIYELRKHIDSMNIIEIGKPVIGVPDHGLHTPGCTPVEDD